MEDVKGGYGDRYERLFLAPGFEGLDDVRRSPRVAIRLSGDQDDGTVQDPQVERLAESIVQLGGFVKLAGWLDTVTPGYSRFAAAIVAAGFEDPEHIQGDLEQGQDAQFEVQSVL